MFQIIREQYHKIKGVVDKHELVSAALFFTLLIAVFFFPVIFNGKTLDTAVLSGGVMPGGPYKYEGQRPAFFPLNDPGAFNWVDEPLSDYIGRVIKEEHRVPLWNPNMGIGYPLLSGIQLGVFFPLNYINFLFSSQTSWDLFFLVRIFLAGFFTYVFARKIGLEKRPSLLAGTLFMFSGYTMAFLNMAHFSSDVLVPLVLLAFESFLRRRTLQNFLFSVLAITLVILPGMPESTAFVLILGGLWFIFSLLFIHKEIFQKLRVFFLFVSVNLLALSLSAIQLIPFWEFMQKPAFDFHSESMIGLAYVPFNTIASMFFPFFFSPPYSWLGYFYYIGISSAILFSITLLSIRAFEKKEKRMIAFFSFFVFLMLAKAFGFSFINWTGSLPILKTLIFPKYCAPEIIFSISMVSAFGYSLLLRKKISFFNSKLFLAFAAMIISTLYTLHAHMWIIIDRMAGTNNLLQNLFKHFINYFNFDLPVNFIENISSSLVFPYSALVITSGVIIFLVFWIIALNTNKNTFPGISILIFVILELFIYTLPLERANRYETYKKPPFVNYLQQDNTIFRIYGQMPNESNAMLFPNISGVFGLQDIRTIMAIEDKRYFMFLKNILGVDKDEIDTIRFTGNSQIPFDNKFFDLLNVKYFLSPPGTSDYALVNQIANGSKRVSDNAEFFKHGIAELNGKQLQGFMLHAPSKIEFPLKVENKYLTFEYGIAEAGIKGSDGAQFSVLAKGENGKEMKLIDDFINPLDKKYKKWQKADLDLSAYAGKIITLSFQTDPGKNNAFDQFFFGNFEAPKDNIVYDKEMTIIENKNVFPRAFIVHRAENLSNPEDIFARLKADNFDIRNQIIIERDLPSKMLNGNGAPENDGSAAMITSYKDQEVIIDAMMENDGFLVLTDQYYPGWKAFIDEKETEIYPTDYTFRSIYLKKGPHTVRFVYDPASYKIGKTISILTLLILFGILWFEKRINVALKQNS